VTPAFPVTLQASNSRGSFLSKWFPASVMVSSAQFNLQRGLCELISEPAKQTAKPSQHEYWRRGRVLVD
jgi:hypothetical protein